MFFPLRRAVRECVADSGEAGFGTGDELLVFFHCNRFMGLFVKFFLK